MGENRYKNMGKILSIIGQGLYSHGTCSAKMSGQMFVLQALLALLGGSVIQDVVHQLGQLVGIRDHDVSG